MHLCCLVALQHCEKRCTGKILAMKSMGHRRDSEPRCLTNFATFREETSQEVIILEMLFAGILAEQQLLLAVLGYFT